MDIEPRQDCVLVKLDPLKDETRNGIIVMKDTTAQRVMTGTVLKVGSGKLSNKGVRIPVGVEPGERIAFFRWNLEHQQGKQITRALEELGEDIGLIRAPDILFAFTGDLRVS
jgi:co-chaperonin GroES (HSP10)